MNILHVSGATGWRGGEQQLMYLFEELALKNISQHLFCPFSGPLNLKVSEKNTEHVIAYKKTAALSLNTALKLKRLCKEKNIDIIHVHDAHAHTMAFLSAFLWGNKTPIVVSRRVDFPIGRSFFSKIKYNHFSIKGIICVSQAIKTIMQHDIKNTQILSVVYSGIDDGRFVYKSKTNKLRALLGLNQEAIIIGNTSALAPHKDYFTFVDTASLILKEIENTVFVVIGEGPLEVEIKNYVKTKGLEKQFFFTGFRNDIHELMPDFDVFLMTSQTEGLGTSILDAFACKVPVVSTNAGGIAEIVSDGISGCVAGIKDPDALCRMVCELIKDEHLKNKMIEGGMHKLQFFTKQKMASETLEIYKKILT